jgi:hypothetical protein
MRIIIVIFLITLTGCNDVMQNVGQKVRNQVDDLKAWFNSIGEKVVGGSTPTPAELLNTGPGTGPDAAVSSGAAKANQELMSEILTVVFHQKAITENPEFRSEFGSLANSLNQGASLEGIYRGIVMGGKYRALENQTGAALPKALKIFARELIWVQLEMKQPTRYTAGDSNRPLEIDFPEGTKTEEVFDAPVDDTMAVNTTAVQSVVKSDPRESDIQKMFLGSSVYILKRVLAEEVMRKIDELKSSPRDLAQWYAQFVMRMAESKVDFGLEQRNQADFDLHFRWAMTASQDRIIWESLNRVHRVLNSESGIR